MVDLKGRFVCPGFIDAHLHFMGGSLSLDSLNLGRGRARSPRSQKRIKAYAERTPTRAWVTGQGWTYGAFPGGMPHEGPARRHPARPARLS